MPGAIGQIGRMIGRQGLSALTTGGGAAPDPGGWLLAGGLWSDTGVWSDAAVWED